MSFIALSNVSYNNNSLIIHISFFINQYLEKFMQISLNIGLLFSLFLYSQYKYSLLFKQYEQYHY